MPKYWVKNYFAHGSFPEVGQNQKMEKREKEKEIPKVGNNNGQLSIAMPPRVAHASRLGQNIIIWGLPFQITRKYYRIPIRTRKLDVFVI